jgi:ubiquinone/menaquinone biosynthesis C-methylase UbiE
MELARARFLAQHHGMATAIGLVTRAAYDAFAPKRQKPRLADLVAVRRRFAELLARDWADAEAGLYPKRLLFDLPVREHLRNLPAFMADAPRVLRRVRRRDHDDLPAGIDRSAYPAYYLRNFHWQTDGWLSERSARLYDFGVDFLFGGSADVMRRRVLPPLVRELGALPRPRVVDIACGTGRTLAMLHAALPGAQLSGVDLSPFYVARAAQRGLPGLSLTVENAEALPYRDGWFDAATLVFLFHELPGDARRRVLAEAHRVVKPGGLVVILDSAQLVDSPEVAYFLESFHRLYHEPYYKGYLADPLEALCAEVGLVVEGSEPCFVAKRVVARRPA